MHARFLLAPPFKTVETVGEWMQRVSNCLLVDYLRLEAAENQDEACVASDSLPDFMLVT